MENSHHNSPIEELSKEETTETIKPTKSENEEFGKLLMDAMVKDFMVKFNTFDVDNEDDLDDKINEIKSLDSYKKYERAWNIFADFCESNNILAKADWTCCNTCGNGEIYREMHQIEKSTGKKYYGYVFYHSQESDSIMNQCQENKNEILVHLSWSYYDEKDEEGDEKCIELAKKIHDVAVNAGCDLDYTDISKKLELKIKIA